MVAAEDIASLASLIASIFAVILVAGTLLRASPSIIGSRRGWALVALGVLVFAVRVLGHFTTDPRLEAVRHVLGFAAAGLLGIGFALVYRDAREQQPGVPRAP